MSLTPRALIVLALGAVPLVLSGVVPGALIAAGLWNLAWLIAVIIDIVLCPRPERLLTAERQLRDALSVAAENLVRVVIHNDSEHPRRVEIRDEPPADFIREGERQAWKTIPARGTVTLDYTITPRTRGDFSFGSLYLGAVGPLGLIRRTGALPLAARVAVFPNLQAVGEYELMLRRTQRARAGLRRARQLGQGREFAALRDYTPDDEFRSIDWKATARRGKVTSRTFEAERTQDVVLLIDEGRLMRQEIGYSQKLDHVVSAALMLAHVVARGDDRVGLLAFSGDVQRWIPPRRGRSQTTEILHALYALRAQPVESDYRLAFRYLAGRWRKRSLMVLFTDLADPDSSAILLSEIAILAASHLVLCVVVRDPLLSASAESTPTDAGQLFEKAVAEEALAERRQTLALLAKRGVLVVDAEPDELSAALVAKYLSVKRAALI